MFDYAIDQGFAFGSGMGTNHHYGYQIRKIYTTAWLMRDEIYKHPHGMLISLHCVSGRLCKRLVSRVLSNVMNCWILGTRLLMARFISAMMFTDAREQAQALEGFSRWLSSSLHYTPGTIGGIKVDGTTFHHGGFYPGYTTGVLAVIGQFIALLTIQF